MTSIESNSEYAAAEGELRAGSDPLSGAGRSAWMLVAGTFATAACLAATAWFWQSSQTAGGNSAAGGQLVVTIEQGPGYGEAAVYLGPAAGSPIADQQSLVEALRRRWTTAAADAPVVVRAAGGVYQREVDRVLRAVRESAPAGRSVTFRITPIENN